MANKRFILTILVIIVVLYSSTFHTGSRIDHVLALESHPSQIQLNNAASYLLSMYNPELGLIANSEDEGPNSLGEVPCNNTYWVYSDNLWAGWALQPFNPTISENMLSTVQNYTATYGRSMLFEAAIGELIPTIIHAKKNIKVYDGIVNGSRVQVLLDRHQYSDNPSIFEDAEEYADLCFYMTINYWMMEDSNASNHWFRIGESMWNHTTNYGFYDKATRNDGRYQNFKLGLFLLAQNVTKLQSNITEKVESAAWSYQNNLGGITTQSWLNGSFYGTANTETTAALLLSYNDQLINRLNKKQSYSKYMLEVTESKLKNATETIEKVSANNYALEEEISSLRNWFTILSISTIALATTTSILVIWVRKLRSLNT